MNSKTRSFTSSEIAKITSNFKTVIGKGGFGKVSVIGKGGFGKVYLGMLKDGNDVAVKVLLSSSEQCRKAVLAEAKLLTIIHHKNLVSLVGYCDEVGSEALIYDYMANGNLKQNLLEESETILSWNERLQIALDVAEGLEYLHGCKPPIIHRDLKPDNILFNKYMRAKIADFGLSRAFSTESASYISTCPAGTFGYLDPKSFKTGHISKKSDLFSFGIILPQLVTGQPAVITRDKEDKINIVNWVDPLIKRGDIWSIVDPRLNGEFSINAAQRAIKIAILCVKPITKRPDIGQVVAELKKCLDIEMHSTRVNGIGLFNCLDRIYKNLMKGQQGTTRSKKWVDGAELPLKLCSWNKSPSQKNVVVNNPPILLTTFRYPPKFYG